jgi:hypothetical protein
VTCVITDDFGQSEESLAFDIGLKFEPNLRLIKNSQVLTMEIVQKVPLLCKNLEECSLNIGFIGKQISTSCIIGLFEISHLLWNTL